MTAYCSNQLDVFDSLMEESRSVLTDEGVFELLHCHRSMLKRRVYTRFVTESAELNILTNCFRLLPSEIWTEVLSYFRLPATSAVLMDVRAALQQPLC